MDTIDISNVSMKLYSSETCIEGHACRIVLYEKQVDCEVEYVDLITNPSVLSELNPYGESPTLADRELVLYGATIIAEYLDDRLPHPPLMPPDPVGRGRSRMLTYRFRREWMNELRALDLRGDKPKRALQGVIRQDLISMSPLLAQQNYLLGEEFSVADCFLMPVLWRLKYYGIELPSQVKPLVAYMHRVLGRESFKRSLSAAEREMA